MKAKYSYLLMLIAVIAMSACQKDRSVPGVYPANGKLKQVLMYQSINSEQPMSILEDYEYNEDGRISKKSSPMYENGVITGVISYDIYEYNAFGQLEKIRDYNANLNSPTGFINLTNTTFSYFADGNTATKTIENIDGSVTELYLYDYKDGRPVKISKFDKGKPESYSVNEFDAAGRLTKETFYLADGQEISYTIHSYSGNLLVKSELYSAPKNSMYRTISRTYDSNGNLILMDSRELFAYSNMMSFVLRYKYFE
jgi:hypothetical protein